MEDDNKHLIGDLEDREVTERESTAVASCHVIDVQ